MLVTHKNKNFKQIKYRASGDASDPYGGRPCPPSPACWAPFPAEGPSPSPPCPAACCLPSGTSGEACCSAGCTLYYTLKSVENLFVLKFHYFREK